MPICITCSTPVKNLYTTYSKADDRALGKGVRLTQCPNCKRFADKYVEHDFVVLFIDLVLIKPQVYRHLLFNRLGRPDDKLDPSILRLGTLLLLFDVYITWARVEKSISANPSDRKPHSHSSLTNAPILLQYLFFLTLNFLATAAHHGTVRLLVRLFFSGTAAAAAAGGSRTTSSASDSDVASHDKAAAADGAQPPQPQPPSACTRTVGPGLASPSAISTALLVSSCTKLFPILLVIWPETTTTTTTTTSKPAPDTTGGGPAPSFASRARSYVGWAVLLNNIEALLILLDCGYATAIGLALAGTMARWAVEGAIFALAGLEGDRGPIGDMLVGLHRVVNLLSSG